MKFNKYPFIRYRLMDIEDDPASQGFSPHEFDVVLAANVLHATSDLRQTLRHIRQMLAPGGLLILLEGPGPQRWLDMVVGSTEGWWKFSDTDLRPSYPLLSQAQWQSLLEEMGFQEATGLTDATEKPPQFLVLAQAPGGTSSIDSTDQPASMPAVRPLFAQPGTWLVFRDKAGIGDQLSAQMRSRGERCVLVSQGEQYGLVGEDHYEIRPASPADFERLISDSLLAAGPPARGVVHLWSLDITPLEEATQETLEEAETLGCLSTAYLVQALLKGERRQSPHVWLVTRGTQPAGPEAATTPPAVTQSPLWGLARVFAAEHSELWGGIIDLDHVTAPDEVHMLLRELAGNDGEDQLAFRCGQRYAPRLRRWRDNAASPLLQPLQFRPDASYLLTGGLGGLGLEVAHLMVEHGARRLILMGRTPLPPRSAWGSLEKGHPDASRVAAVRSLEAEGASIHLPVVDVSNEAQLASFFAEYEREGWPPIRGVVHTAGLIKDQLPHAAG